MVTEWPFITVTPIAAPMMGVARPITPVDVGEMVGVEVLVSDEGAPLDWVKVGVTSTMEVGVGEMVGVEEGVIVSEGVGVKELEGLKVGVGLMVGVRVGVSVKVAVGAI